MGALCADVDDGVSYYDFVKDFCETTCYLPGGVPALRFDCGGGGGDCKTTGPANGVEQIFRLHCVDTD